MEDNKDTQAREYSAVAVNFPEGYEMSDTTLKKILSECDVQMKRAGRFVNGHCIILMPKSVVNSGAVRDCHSLRIDFDGEKVTSVNDEFCDSIEIKSKTDTEE